MIVFEKKKKLVSGRVYRNTGEKQLIVLLDGSKDERARMYPHSVVKYYKKGETEPDDAWPYPTWAVENP